MQSCIFSIHYSSLHMKAGFHRKMQKLITTFYLTIQKKIIIILRNKKNHNYKFIPKPYLAILSLYLAMLAFYHNISIIFFSELQIVTILNL